MPRALEVFAPFRILKRLDKDVIESGVDQVRRALVAGGEEAAQEAASGFAQNLIARGIYKPEQELIEGLGEQAAYGGATGAIVQGLLDLAIGRRARGRLKLLLKPHPLNLQLGCHPLPRKPLCLRKRKPRLLLRSRPLKVRRSKTSPLPKLKTCALKSEPLRGWRLKHV